MAALAETHVDTGLAAEGRSLLCPQALGTSWGRGQLGGGGGGGRSRAAGRAGPATNWPVAPGCSRGFWHHL